jgi:hypothetical protein
MASGDAFQEFGLSMLGNTTAPILQYTTNNQERVACVPRPELTVIKEQLWVTSTQTSLKMRKGSLRWLVAIANAAPGPLYDNGRFVGISYASAAQSHFGPFALGPWDGSTPGGYS